MELPLISIFGAVYRGVAQNKAYPFGSKDYSIWGSILEYPYVGKIPYRVIVYGLEFKRNFG